MLDAGSATSERLPPSRAPFATVAYMAERARVRAIVSGSVQGVGFRYWASDEARRLGLAGFVANRADGTVETEAEGDRDAVDAYLTWLGHGPQWAEVSDVATSDIDVTNEIGFRIDQ